MGRGNRGRPGLQPLPSDCCSIHKGEISHSHLETDIYSGHGSLHAGRSGLFLQENGQSQKELSRVPALIDLFLQDRKLRILVKTWRCSIFSSKRDNVSGVFLHARHYGASCGQREERLSWLPHAPLCGTRGASASLPWSRSFSVVSCS